MIWIGAWIEQTVLDEGDQLADLLFAQLNRRNQEWIKPRQHGFDGTGRSGQTDV